MTEQKPCRADLMNHINAVSFTVDDTRLFLNTHPDNQDALDFLEEYSRKRMHALKEHASYYGPLTMDTIDTPANFWKWVNEPWPWQKGGC